MVKAQAAGIPVIGMNSSLSAEDVPLAVSNVGADYYQQAVVAGKMMVDALGGKGKVVMIKGNPATEPARLRDEGFMEGIKGSEIEVIAKQSADWDKAKATAVMEDFLTRYPEIDGIYGQDDTMAIGAMLAIEAAGIEPGKIKVVGVGMNGEAMEAMKAGTFYGSVTQSGGFEGRYAMRVAVDYLEGRMVPDYIYTPMIKVTADR
jgi:ribose transport system substrate-binding protein